MPLVRVYLQLQVEWLVVLDLQNQLRLHHQSKLEVLRDLLILRQLSRVLVEDEVLLVVQSLELDN